MNKISVFGGRSGKAAVVIVIIIALIAAAAAGYYFLIAKKASDKKTTVDTRVTDKLTGKKCKSLPSRPVMVSTDNDSYLARPQRGLSYADIVYEVPAEGGATRLEPLYYSRSPRGVGPCRSARPYIIDIAREYKAVFVHHGWSPQARHYLQSGKVHYINAMTNGSGTKIFHRSNKREAPHNSYANYKRIWKVIKEKGWDKKQKIKTGFKFYDNGSSADPAKRDLQNVSRIVIKFPAVKDTYRYNKKNKKYYKTVDGAVYVDQLTGKQIRTDNVLVQYAKSSIIETVHNRLKIDMCAGGKATLFTHGKKINGKWSRKDLDSSTLFKDNNGHYFKLAKGTTWICIVDQYVRVSYFGKSK